MRRNPQAPGESRMFGDGSCSVDRFSQWMDVIRNGTMFESGARWRPLDLIQRECPMRGFTLIESLLALIVAGALLAIAIPGTRTLLHGSAVRGAALEVEMLLSAARQAARARGTMATFEMDTIQAQVTISVGSDTIRTRRVCVVYDVG